MSRNFLYRRLGLCVTLTGLLFPMMIAGLASQAAAQGRPELKRPQETPEEKPVEPKKKKKEKGPRAVGILQMGDGKTTLIPVAILIDGKFHDASVYKAEPVPMALEGGTVYEAEEAGESQGLFTVNGALHAKAAANPNPWVGTGSYLANGAEAPKSTRKAEDRPVGLDSSGDEPPRLTRGKSPGESSKSDSTQSKTEAAKTGAAPTSEKADEKKTDVSQEAGKVAKAGSQEQPAASQKTAEDAKSAASKAKDQNSSSQSQMEGTQKNYYRPTLRRGKPTQAAPDEVDSPVKADAGQKLDTAASATPAGRLVAAISDDGGPDPQSYKFFWKEGEEEERRKQLLALAAEEVRAYVNARAKGAIPARPSGAKTLSSHKSATKSAPPEFENVQFHAYDVWKNDQPVMIFTAEARIPSGVESPATSLIYSVTLAAKTDIYGNLRKLFAGVTDKFHLDVTPKLELIDAVDVDGDGRGELLFREVEDGASGYAIYRATPDKLWKMFDSLAAE